MKDKNRKIKTDFNRKQYGIEIYIYKLLNYDKYEEIEEKHLKSLYNSATFDHKIFELGEKWCDVGLSLEDAPVQYRDNASFISGFNRGKRLKLIDKLEEDNNKTR